MTPFLNGLRLKAAAGSLGEADVRGSEPPARDELTGAERSPKQPLADRERPARLAPRCAAQKATPAFPIRSRSPAV